MSLCTPNSVFKSVAIASLLAGSTLALVGCENQPQGQLSDSAQQEQMMKTLTTQVTYQDRSMLRPGAKLTVTLADVSKMDVKAEIINKQEVDITGAPPYTVELKYDPSKIKDRHRYIVMARITNQDRLLYVSTMNNDPFANAQTDTPLNIVVSKVAAKKPDTDLVNTYWKALTVNDTTVTVKTKEPFIQFKADGTTHGFLGCNNFSGGYESSAQTLSFKPLASTKKTCMEQMKFVNLMSQALDQTSQYSINGEVLTLEYEQGNPLATFKAMYFN